MYNPNLAIIAGLTSANTATNRLSLFPSAEPIVSWAIFKQMGVLRLDSFMPVMDDSFANKKTVRLIESLLENELKDTKSLVFDLRDNG
jgi:C-terminal processing protease CtpA/Prc